MVQLATRLSPAPLVIIDSSKNFLICEGPEEHKENCPRKLLTARQLVKVMFLALNRLGLFSNTPSAVQRLFPDKATHKNCQYSRIVEGVWRPSCLQRCRVPITLPMPGGQSSS
ncbi:uncharacterized protein LOC115158596 isoform X2 [Salmo trutta]|uniref:uncharacterized protein LOC115158596 isoform X2 n=1 Tax=Salmo trutta TaxID=8032 RepID=UPI001130CA10|nr:uncharacterized protein LOC115158596 isoform X2 [Salmo trutta]